jgi:hypothetical protein
MTTPPKCLHKKENMDLSSVSDPHWFHCGFGCGTRILMTKNYLKKITVEKNLHCFDETLQFIYPLASVKDVHATAEAFTAQKRTSSTSKHEIS